MYELSYDFRLGYFTSNQKATQWIILVSIRLQVTKETLMVKGEQNETHYYFGKLSQIFPIAS